jgi:putative ABC transport system permease protein
MKSILARFVCALMVTTASAAACREQNQYVEPPASSYAVTTVELATDSARDSVRAAFVQPDFFRASNVRAIIGRLLVADEFRNTPSTLVISKDLWERRFRAEPTVIGRKLRVNGQEATIVGVVPADFTFPKNVSAWVPGPPK